MARRRKAKDRRLLYVVVALIAILSMVVIYQSLKASDKKPETLPAQETQIIIGSPVYHAHVDFKVFINGNEVDFNRPEYDEADRFMHLHLRNPEGDRVMHIEGAENIPIGRFFESLGMQFNASCFVMDTGEEFCNDYQKRIRFFVDGEENFRFDLYEPIDANMILITYGSETDEEILEQMDSVTDMACIFSGKCRERLPELPVPEDQLAF